MGGEPNGKRLMTSAGWSFVGAAARLLARDEREAVLGDLVEAGESVWQGLFGVLGLVFRREAVFGKAGGHGWQDSEWRFQAAFSLWGSHCLSVGVI